MKGGTQLLYILLIGLFFYACTGGTGIEDVVIDELPPDPPTYLIIDPDDEANFIIKDENQIVSQDEVKLKLIDDGLDYIEISSSVSVDWHSNSKTYNNNIRVLTNECQILGYYYVDTLIHYRAFDDDLQLECRYRRLQSEVPSIPDADIIDRIPRADFLPLHFTIGDTIDFEAEFEYVDTGVLLYDHSTSFVSETGDCFRSSWVIGIWKHMTPAEVGYLQFKINKSEGIYYGWIEMHSRGGEVEIHRIGYYLSEN